MTLGTYSRLAEVVSRISNRLVAAAKPEGLPGRARRSATRSTLTTSAMKSATNSEETTPKTTVAIAPQELPMNPDRPAPLWGMLAFVRPIFKATPTIISTTTVAMR